MCNWHSQTWNTVQTNHIPPQRLTAWTWKWWVWKMIFRISRGPVFSGEPPFIFRSVYTRKTGICYISLPSTSQKGSWIYLILSGPLGVIFTKTTPRFMGRVCCTPCKRVSFFFLGGGVREKRHGFFQLQSPPPPKKTCHFFSKSSFFNYNLPWPTDPLTCSHRWLHHFSWCLT